MSKNRFLESPGQSPNCLLFSQRERKREREREREREKKISRRRPIVRGWSCGAIVLGKLSVPRPPTNNNG